MGVIFVAYPEVSEIQHLVEETYNIQHIDMISRRRMQYIARPRQVAMYLARHLTLLSLPEIGRHFGGRDHSTVMHAVDRVETLMRYDQQIADTVKALRHRLVS